MKKIFVMSIMLLMLAGCSSSQDIQEAAPSGKPEVEGPKGAPEAVGPQGELPPDVF